MCSFEQIFYRKKALGAPGYKIKATLSLWIIQMEATARAILFCCTVSYIVCWLDALLISLCG